MISLASRSRSAEQMDDPGLDPEIYQTVLKDLSQVNRWTLAARPTLSFLRRAIGPAKRFRLLDVGFGHGDMLRRIGRWAKRRGISAELVGADLNPNSVEAARAATAEELNIDYRTGDYRDQQGPFDVIVSSLVAHHMSDLELRQFIQFMEEKARCGWLINDLHRHWLSYLGYRHLARLLRTHRIVREDGTLSIARSFRPAEWRAILGQAGVPEGAVRIFRSFPYRLCVERLR
jgi:2-polyprenyl-3-methyl-5-hydroxy-6-metoxy-1,4-benzoquinol methylase